MLAAVLGGAAGCGDEASTPASASERVDGLFAPLTTGVQPGAAVMVIRDGRIVHQAGYGYADLANRVPITPDSAFNLASVSKRFTAMAIMILAASNALDYDDLVSRYLPQLAPLVEAVSGMDFASFMSKRVFVPAGMQHSLIHDHTLPIVPGRAFGYEPEGDGYSLNDDDPLNGIVGSGSMYSTLNDFFRWDQVLYGETLVSRDALDEAFAAARLNNGKPVDYGFGWRLDEYEGRRRVRHGGSWVGFRTHIARYPDERFTIVILANRADVEPETYIDAVTGIYLGKAGR